MGQYFKKFTESSNSINKQFQKKYGTYKKSQTIIPNFTTKNFLKNLLALEIKKIQIFMDKLIYFGLSIL